MWGRTASWSDPHLEEQEVEGKVGTRDDVSLVLTRKGRTKKRGRGQSPCARRRQFCGGGKTGGGREKSGSRNLRGGKDSGRKEKASSWICGEEIIDLVGPTWDPPGSWHGRSDENYGPNERKGQKAAKARKCGGKIGVGAGKG